MGFCKYKCNVLTNCLYSYKNLIIKYYSATKYVIYFVKILEFPCLYIYLRTCFTIHTQYYYLDTHIPDNFI